MRFHTPTLFKSSWWNAVLVGVLLFWLSTTVLLDFVVMPSLYSSGMMNEPGFAAAGYTLFGVFNQLELLCAGLVLTGILVVNFAAIPPQWMVAVPSWRQPAIAFAVGLFGIALVCTYVLTPGMSSLGLSLDALNPQVIASANMDLWHGSYWLLDATKLSLTAALLRIVGHRATTAPATFTATLPSSSWQ